MLDEVTTPLRTVVYILKDTQIGKATPIAVAIAIAGLVLAGAIRAETGHQTKSLSVGAFLSKADALLSHMRGYPATTRDRLTVVEAVADLLRTQYLCPSRYSAEFTLN